MKDIKKLLKPYNIHKTKLRIGNQNLDKKEYDGGYIITEHETNICTAFYSYGVGEDITADRDFYNLTKKPCYLYDHTIDGSVVFNSGLPFKFKREGLGFTPNCNDFLTHYKENNTKGEVILKIDVEGAEYDYLDKVNLEELESKVASLLIEFHHLDNKDAVQVFERIVNKLNKYFVLLHIHCNNYGNITDGIPSVPELSFINKRHVSKIEEQNIIYPVKGLDFPNTYQYDDIQLDFSSGVLEASYIKPSEDIPPPPQRIPNKLHFVFGLSEDFGGKPWKLCHYLAVKSAIELNKPEKAYFYYKHKPTGKWFEKLEDKLDLVQIEPPKEIFGNPLLHVAHQTGVIRLQVLLEEGGVYMDVDTISKKPFTNLLHHKCVLGIQGTPGGNIEGLCDGVILAEKDSEFLKHWLLSYKSHRSKGRDQYWAEHAVQMPYTLSKQYPHLLHIEPYSSFHYPLYHGDEPITSTHGLKVLFEQDHDFEKAYCHHVWESMTWEPYLKDLTTEKIKNNKTTYNNIARKFI